MPPLSLASWRRKVGSLAEAEGSTPVAGGTQDKTTSSNTAANTPPEASPADTEKPESEVAPSPKETDDKTSKVVDVPITVAPRPTTIGGASSISRNAEHSQPATAIQTSTSAASSDSTVLVEPTSAPSPAATATNTGSSLTSSSADPLPSTSVVSDLPSDSSLVVPQLSLVGGGSGLIGLPLPPVLPTILPSVALPLPELPLSALPISVPVPLPIPVGGAPSKGGKDPTSSSDEPAPTAAPSKPANDGGGLIPAITSGVLGITSALTNVLPLPTGLSSVVSSVLSPVVSEVGPVVSDVSSLIIDPVTSVVGAPATPNTNTGKPSLSTEIPLPVTFPSVEPPVLPIPATTHSTIKPPAETSRNNDPPATAQPPPVTAQLPPQSPPSPGDGDNSSPRPTTIGNTPAPGSAAPTAAPTTILNAPDGSPGTAVPVPVTLTSTQVIVSPQITDAASSSSLSRGGLLVGAGAEGAHGDDLASFTDVSTTDVFTTTFLSSTSISGTLTEVPVTLTLTKATVTRIPKPTGSVTGVSTKSDSKSTNAIVGGAIGAALALLFLSIVLLILFRRRRRRQEMRMFLNASPEPFPHYESGGSVMTVETYPSFAEAILPKTTPSSPPTQQMEETSARRGPVMAIPRKKPVPFLDTPSFTESDHQSNSSISSALSSMSSLNPLHVHPLPVEESNDPFADPAPNPFDDPEPATQRQDSIALIDTLRPPAQADKRISAASASSADSKLDGGYGIAL